MKYAQNTLPHSGITQLGATRPSGSATLVSRYAALGLAMIAVAIICIPAAAQAAPQVKTQPPGWYRIMLGDFEVTALYDGYEDQDPKRVLLNTSPGEVEKDMERAFEPGSTLLFSFNAFLINTGSKLILVDTGAGRVLPTGGKLMENLKAAGYTPEQVDMILLTHLHADHLGGLIGPDGKPVFQNAKVMVSTVEAAYWSDPATRASFPKEMQPFVDMATAPIKPLKAAGLWSTFAPNAEISQGVKAVATGHTPGHSAYLFESKGQKLFVMGDLVHVASVEFSNLGVGFFYDTDVKKAVASRKEWVPRMVKDKMLVAGAHLPFPGLGHVRSEGSAYAWVPVEFSPIR